MLWAFVFLIDRLQGTYQPAEIVAHGRADASSSAGHVSRDSGLVVLADLTNLCLFLWSLAVEVTAHSCTCLITFNEPSKCCFKPYDCSNHHDRVVSRPMMKTEMRKRLRLVHSRWVSVETIMDIAGWRRSSNLESICDPNMPSLSQLP